jgi:hypothetical protein
MAEWEQLLVEKRLENQGASFVMLVSSGLGLYKPVLACDWWSVQSTALGPLQIKVGLQNCVCYFSKFD